MTTYGKCVFTGTCVVAAYAAMLQGFRLMNRPSDVSLYFGLGIVLAILVAMPPVLRAIWERT